MNRSALPFVRGVYGMVRFGFTTSSLHASRQGLERLALSLPERILVQLMPWLSNQATARSRTPNVVACFSLDSAST